jgi:S-adenosylmethionine:tRNA ribosyltransferase-isomerase
MLIKSINISNFDYNLPGERIAKYPLPDRDLSKLLVFRSGKISHDVFKHIVGYLPSGSLMVFNNSRVIPARLIFRKETGARIEIFLLEPVLPADYQQNFSSASPVVWKCIVGNRKKWKKGDLNRFNDGRKSSIIMASLLEDQLDHQIIRFSWEQKDTPFIELIEQAGSTPIPPYLERDAEESDRKTYQTIYGSVNGSVAAPTAGLHFTPSVFSEIEKANISFCELTLHVGAGTFQPVKEIDISKHPMHREHFAISRNILEQLLKHKGPVTSVGTTSLRSLESIYWLGVKCLQNTSGEKDNLHVNQWDGTTFSEIPPEEALSCLLGKMNEMGTSKIVASTSLMIVPGYKFRIADCLITNFHQPKSTLLLLIAAFAGDKWKDIYEYALANDFRFLSYGDSSILIPEKINP